MSRVEQGKERIIIDDFRGGLVTNVDPAKLELNQFSILENIDMLNDFEQSIIARKPYIPIQYNVATPENTTANTFTNAIALYWKKFKKVLVSEPTYYFYLLLNSNKIKIFKETVVTAVKELTLDFNLGATNAHNFYNNLYITDTADRTGDPNQNAVNPNLVISAETEEEHGCPPCPQTFSLSVSGTLISQIPGEGDYSGAARQYAITFLYDNQQRSYIIPVNNTSSHLNTEISLGFTQGQPLVNTAFALRSRPSSYDGDTTHCNLITNIPVGNSRVVAREIWCRLSTATSKYLYLIGTLDNNIDTSFLDTVRDTLFANPYTLPFVYRPPNAKYVSSHKECLLIANTFDRQYTKNSAITNSTGFQADYSGEINVCCTTLAANGANAIGPIHRFILKDMFPIISSKGEHLGGFTSEYVGTYTYEKEITARATSLPVSDGNGGKKYLSSTVYWTMANQWAMKGAFFRNICMFIRKITVKPNDILRLHYGIAIWSVSEYVWIDIGDTLFLVDEYIEIKQMGTTELNGIHKVLAAGTEQGSSISLAPDYLIPYIEISYGDVVNLTAGDCILSTKYYYLGMTPIGASGNQVTDMPELELYAGHNNFESKYFTNLRNENRAYMLMMSDVGQGDIFQPENERPVGYTDNTEIKFISPEDNAIMIFKETSIWKLNTNSISKDYWQLTMLTDTIGVQSDKAIVAIDSRQYIFWFQGKCYHMFSSTSEPIPCSKRINPILPSNFLVVFSYYDNKNERVMFFGNDYKIYIYDLKFRTEQGLGKWYIHKSAYNLPFTKAYSGPSQESYFIGGDEIYKYNEHTIANDFLWRSDT